MQGLSPQLQNIPCTALFLRRVVNVVNVKVVTWTHIRKYHKSGCSLKMFVEIETMEDLGLKSLVGLKLIFF